jgi:hypothetical protein
MASLIYMLINFSLNSPAAQPTGLIEAFTMQQDFSVGRVGTGRAAFALCAVITVGNIPTR